MKMTYVLEAQAAACEMTGSVLRMMVQIPWLAQLNGGEMGVEEQRQTYEEMFLEYLLEDEDTFLLKKTALQQEASDSNIFVWSYNSNERPNKTGPIREEGDLWAGHRMLPQAIVEGARVRVLSMEQTLAKVLSKKSMLEEPFLETEGELHLKSSKMGKMG